MRSTRIQCRLWTSGSLRKPSLKTNSNNRRNDSILTRSVFTFCLSNSIRKWNANVWFPCISYKFSSIFDFCTIHYREWGWCRYFGHFCSLWMHLRRSLSIPIARKYLELPKKSAIGVFLDKNQFYRYKSGFSDYDLSLKCTAKCDDEYLQCVSTCSSSECLLDCSRAMGACTDCKDPFRFFHGVNMVLIRWFSMPLSYWLHWWL